MGLLLLTLIVPVLLPAQDPAAWIDFNQTYFKIKITQEGLYQIKAPTL
ncbi:MAG: hypothetical protein HC913_23720, partial [Microscillaceae bacterium]|nr:hypothetical protein [Microscillaceae bacterium]